MDEPDEPRRSYSDRRSRAPSASPTRRAAARWGLAAIVVGSALAMGTVYTTVLIVVALAAVIVFGLHFWDARPLELRREAKVLLVVATVLTVWTFVQQIPLPASVVAAVAPGNADIWDRCLMPLREPGPTSMPLSLDPTATRVQVLRGVLYLMVFACALRSASRTDGVKFLGRAVLASSTLLAIAAVAHRALGMRKVFGLIQPTSVDFGTRIAPLLNPNHLSAYINLGGCIALAGALSRASRVPRIALLGLYLLLVGVQLWLGSRAGVAAMVLGTLLVLWLSRSTDGKRGGVSPIYAALGALLVASVAVFVLGKGGQTVADLSSLDTIKLQLIRRSTELLRVFPLVGVGRGAFESVFPAFRADAEGHLVATHPENIAIQWGAEWGLPLGLGALAVTGWALRPAAALARSSVPVGPAAALLAVVVHNLLDFSIEIPAVAIALAVCAGCTVGGAGDSERPAAPAWWTLRPRVLVGVAGATTTLAAALAATTIGRDLRADEARLRDLAGRSSVDRTTFAGAVREAMLRHPAAPYLPFMGAVRAARVRDESSIPWIARTLERASVYGRAHLLLARQLGPRHPAQARLEYRLAMEQDPTLMRAAIREGAELVQSGDDAFQLIPDDPRLTDMALEQLAAALRPTRPDAADRVEQELARRNPRSPVVARIATERALVALRTDPACAAARAPCVASATAAAAHYKEIAPAECASHRAAAEVAVEAGDPGRAFAELDRAMDAVSDRASCARYLVELATSLNDDARVSMALERFLAAGCATDAECAATYLNAAQVEERRRNSRRALSYAKRASERAPDRNDILAVVARLAAATGDHDQALRIYQTLQGREPSNAGWAEKAAAERAAVTASRRRVLGIEKLTP